MNNRSKYFNDDLRLLLILRKREKVKARANLSPGADARSLREGADHLHPPTLLCVAPLLLPVKTAGKSNTATDIHEEMNARKKYCCISS
jgi:hypothetical protein